MVTFIRFHKEGEVPPFRRSFIFDSEKGLSPSCCRFQSFSTQHDHLPPHLLGPPIPRPTTTRRCGGEPVWYIFFSFFKCREEGGYVYVDFLLCYGEVVMSQSHSKMSINAHFRGSSIVSYHTSRVPATTLENGVVFEGEYYFVYNINNNLYIYSKTRTPTHKNPYPRVRVRVFVGTGTGFSEIPGGYPCHSLHRIGLFRSGHCSVVEVLPLPQLILLCWQFRLH